MRLFTVVGTTTILICGGVSHGESLISLARREQEQEQGQGQGQGQG